MHRKQQMSSAGEHLDFIKVHENTGLDAAKRFMRELSGAGARFPVHVVSIFLLIKNYRPSSFKNDVRVKHFQTDSN